MPNYIRPRKPSEIPDRMERQDAEKRALGRRGWNGDRAMEHLRSKVREDREGRKVVDLNK